MMCYSLYYEGRYRDAIAYSRRAGELHAGCSAPGCIASALMALGDIDGAIKELNLSERPTDPKSFFVSVAKRLAQTQGSYDAPFQIAAMYARADRADDAFAWLEKAYERRASMLTNVNVDPAFDSLRGDPRYDDLLRRIGLPKVSRPGA
jgi:tetratricopeptide (TPR) repeat protein